MPQAADLVPIRTNHLKVLEVVEQIACLAPTQLLSQRVNMVKIKRPICRAHPGLEFSRRDWRSSLAHQCTVRFGELWT